ncbi:MAG: GTPase, partial [Planctomycetota bacterium]|nr:GTPase [Planctomycetota bacterium]
LALIRARDDREREAAVALLEGGVERRAAVVRDRVLHALVPLELSFDFSDQDVEVPLPEGAVDGLRRSLVDLDALVEGVREQGAARGCYRAVLEGPANAGKSSLFNHLVGREDALVTPIPGTTRDVLCAEVEVEGCRFELVDTAGGDVTRAAADKEAHEQRRRRLREADLVIEVHDIRRRPARARHDQVLVLTHTDLCGDDPLAESGTALAVSNVTGDGVAAVRRAIAVRLVERSSSSANGPVLITGRQAHGFRVARERIASAAEGLDRGEGPELIASDLHAALGHLREVIGEDVGDDVLDRVFRDFCIGK